MHWCFQCGWIQCVKVIDFDTASCLWFQSHAPDCTEISPTHLSPFYFSLFKICPIGGYNFYKILLLTFSLIFLMYWTVLVSQAGCDGTHGLYLVGCGYNAYPTGSQYAEYPQMDNKQEDRQRRKYRYIVHAEQNALTFRSEQALFLMYALFTQSHSKQCLTHVFLLMPLGLETSNQGSPPCCL